MPTQKDLHNNSGHASQTFNQKLKTLFKHFKQPCLLCHSHCHGLICDHCEHYLLKPRYSCQTCALPLEQPAIRCGSCLRDKPAYDEVFAPYLYQAPISQLITSFKQNKELAAGHALIQLFIREVEDYYQQQHKKLPELITPTPLHWYKQSQRGFNQSAILSHALAKHFSIPQFTHVKRVKQSKEQKKLSRKQRLSSLKGHFIVGEKMNKQSIVIVDDVMTTGATANTLAALLKKAGAGHVSVWALARTPYK